MEQSQYCALSEWNCMPKQNTGNPNAIVFAINDGYSFAVANIIMGIKAFSPELLQKTDIIIYHNGVQEKHQRLLRELHECVLFEDMVFPDIWEPIMGHEIVQGWGSYIIVKFFAFELIKRYERILTMDADVLIRGDIAPLFELEEEMAWRKIVAWDPDKLMEPCKKNASDVMRAGNGGLYCFSSALRKYGIGCTDVLQAYERVKTIPRGGIDEILMGYLAYDNAVTVRELDMEVYNTPAYAAEPSSRLIHFLYYKGETTKPWKTLAAYFYFEDWVKNYRRWLEMGGEGPIAWTAEDYYTLFAFDKTDKIKSLKKKLKKRDARVAELEEENKQIGQLTHELEEARRELETREELLAKKKAQLTEKEKRISELEKQLREIKSSKSWKLTKPLRKLVKFVKKVLGR